MKAKNEINISETTKAKWGKLLQRRLTRVRFDRRNNIIFDFEDCGKQDLNAVKKFLYEVAPQAPYVTVSNIGDNSNMMTMSVQFPYGREIIERSFNG